MEWSPRFFAFIAAFAAVAAAAAPTLGAESPFAASAVSARGSPGTPVAQLEELMGEIQFRHMKIWYAVKSKNWALLEYELKHLRDSFDGAVVLYQNIPIEFIVAVDRPIGALQGAAASKDASKLERGFAELTTACNSCHQAAQVGFIHIRTPTASPFGDQEFAPNQK